MQEYWELYMKNLDGKVASILFNAGISMEIEKIKYIYPQIAFVKVKLKEPNDRGLVSKDEEVEISFLEDKLEASLIKFRIGKYVGRIFSDEYVTFIYYLQFTYNWQDFLNYALDEHSSYEITSGFKEDSNWNYYYNLLYPNSKEWQIIHNHKTCDRLVLAKDNLYIPRAIEHKLFLEEDISIDTIDRDTNIKKLISALNRDGFKILKEIEKDGIKGFSFYRIDKPFYTYIDELTLELIDKLERYGASYDGWETTVVKS